MIPAMTKLTEKLSELAASEDTEGMAVLLESWPENDRGDDWIAAVEVRMRAPSSSDDQKSRMRELRKAFRDASGGSDLAKIRTSLAVVKKLIELEDAKADFDAADVVEWLDSFDAIELFMEKLKRVPNAICRMRNLERLELNNLRLPRLLRRIDAVPDSLALLTKLKVLNVGENKLTTLPNLPTGLRTLIVNGNPKLKLDLSGMSELEELHMDGLDQPPIGIEDLTALKKLSWQESSCEEFPEAFLTLPGLTRANIRLADSEMELPAKEQPKEFSRRFDDEELDEIAMAMIAFNATLPGLDFEDDEAEDFVLVECELASQELVESLENQSGIKLPASLKKFYREIGGINHRYRGECHVVDVPVLEEQLRDLTTEIGRQKSMGLVDCIVWPYRCDLTEWGLTQEELEQANRRFTCFGTRRGDWGLEAAHFLYFDESGRFGSIYFHQSGDDDFPTELKSMLAGDSVAATLPGLIKECLTATANELRNREID